jgi:hypothetical protein
MRNKLFYFAGLTVLSAIYAAPSASLSSVPVPVTFPAYGFSINPFELPTDGPVLQALQMSWPILPMPSNKNQGFAPAVSVMIMPGTDDMAQYETKERLDLQMHGLTIQKEKINTENTDWSIEYVGVAGGAGMHWYAHVVSSAKRIFIATGTAPDEMWGQFGDKIKACVDSLKGTGTAQIAPVPTMTLSTTPAMAAPAATSPAAAPMKLTP